MSKVVENTGPNIFTRYWNGDIRLVYSYWLWGVLGNYAWAAVSVLISMRAGSILLYFVMVLPAMIFIMVGLWRSADKYEGKFWGGAVKVLIVIGVLGFIIKWAQVGTIF